MHLSRVAVSESAWRRLRDAFTERLVGERALFEHLDALHDDVRVFALLLRRRHGDPGGGLAVPGAGFFLPDGGGAAPSATALALRERLLRTYGPDVLRDRARAVRAALARLSEADLAGPSADVPPDGYPRFPYAFSSRYRDLVTALAALRALDGALPLRPDARWSPAGPDLDATERARLGAYADRLGDALTRLLASSRPDWGFPVLVGLARLEAIRESERTGRLLVLDAFAPVSETVPPDYVRRHPQAVAELRTEAAENLARIRARLREADVVDEGDYAALESAGNRLLELDTAPAAHRALRTGRGALVPSREAVWTDLVQPDVPDDVLVRRLSETTAAATRYADRLRTRFGYDLVRRNCVSELLRTVADTGVDPGGHVDPRWSLDFVPFMAARAVNDTWSVTERTTVPSYRRARLDEMTRAEPAVRVGLRESNVLTSTVYRRNADDSFFLFFTDDVAALRPVFGTVNLAAGLGATAVGLPLLPVDGGHTLLAGLRGALFSLPELVFVGVRKGSFDHVPRDQSPP